MGDISKEPAAGGGQGSESADHGHDSVWRSRRPSVSGPEHRFSSPEDIPDDPGLKENTFQESAFPEGGLQDRVWVGGSVEPDECLGADLGPEPELLADTPPVDPEQAARLAAFAGLAESPLLDGQAEQAPMAPPARDESVTPLSLQKEIETGIEAEDGNETGLLHGPSLSEWTPVEEGSEAARVDAERVSAEPLAEEPLEAGTPEEVHEESAPAEIASILSDDDQTLAELARTEASTTGPELVEVAELSDPTELARVLCAVLLTNREPLSVLRLAQVCNATQQAVRAGLDALEAELRRSGLPLTVAHTDETVRILTLPEVFPYLERQKGIRKADRLSPAALETLAVVAYRQPVMRVEIEAIRGVKVGPMLRSLLEHKLVTVVGRADVPGRPLQYGTTQQFLDRFGLASLKDLPSLKEARSLQ